MTRELTPIDPDVALNQYLQSRQSELADASLRAHKDRLRLFVQWCEENNVRTIDELSPRDLHDFSTWRQQGIKQDGISVETLRSALLTLRVFLRFCVSIDAADPELPERIVLPTSATRSRDVMLEADDAEAILEHLNKYEYASDQHVMMLIMWHTGIRAGSLRALDVEDVLEDKQALRIRHRPDSGTPLKNGTEANRLVAISADVLDVILDHIDRRDIVSDNGRTPLIATAQGRRSRQSIRANSYYWSVPCRRGECPHERDINDCEATSWKGAAKCPSSRSTHPIRRGAITHHLKEGTPVPAASDRMDVTPAVLEEHYSRLDESEAMERRREFLPGNDDE